MFELLDQITLPLALLAAATLGLAPFFPEPHIWQKLKMLKAGTLKRPLDIFDLFLHGLPFAVLFAKLIRMAVTGG